MTGPPPPIRPAAVPEVAAARSAHSASNASSSPLTDVGHNAVSDPMDDVDPFPPPGNEPEASWEFIEPAMTRGDSLGLTSPSGPNLFSHTSITAGKLDYPAEVGRVRSVWFTKYHPWFPILHHTSLDNAAVRSSSSHSNSNLVYEAVVAVLSSDNMSPLQQQASQDRSKREESLRCMRDSVVQAAMGTTSLQSVQALLIISIHYYAEASLTMYWNILAVCKR